MWALKIFALEFGMVMISSIIIYLFWKASHPGQNF